MSVAENSMQAEKIHNILHPLSPGEVKFSGYVDKLVKFTIDHQLLDSSTWEIFVEQFRLHSDNDNCWRGEYWGKMMRGACMTYSCTKNQKLYSVLESSVLDLLSTQDSLGRITTYPLDKEFNGWDMWVRKYVMLGLLYFYDICKNKILKRKILRALTKHADYIVSHIGSAAEQKPILETSGVWGGLNSASILEPFVLLYKLIPTPAYLRFAQYIADTGFCKDMNLIELCLHKSAFPYQFKQTKAYEMMSCFEGLLALYQVTGNPDYRESAINFADMVAETDITIIGCAGCTHELFDHSTVRQTEYSDTVMQETCVTVTWMKLNYRLLLLTGESRFVDRIERSALNAMAGAVNSECQTMHRTKAMVYTNGEPENVPHESFPFDSYSPLFNNRRGEKVGGFKKMQHGRSYGCCACIGSAGTALTEIFGVLKGDNALFINLYNQCSVKTTMNGTPLKLQVFGNLYNSGHMRIKVFGHGRFALKLRIPAWSEVYKIRLNGTPLNGTVNNGYFTIENEWANDQIDVLLDDAIKMHRLNDKIAFTKGPFVLAADKRLEKDLTVPLELSSIKSALPSKHIKNPLFSSNITIELLLPNTKLTLCDYAQAGKNYDDENSGLSVWFPQK